MAIYCMGFECSVKHTCLRYTNGLGAEVSDKEEKQFIFKCTRQKRYIQDKNNVNTDGKDYR